MAITQYGVPLEAAASATANVKELYKGNLVQEIRADLAPRRTPLVSIFMNLTHDFNKATAIRANNAFLGQEVYFVGQRRYDRRGTVGTHNYETIFHADTLEEVVEHLKAQGYQVYAVENSPEYEPKSLWEVTFPEKTALLFGEEQLGLSPEAVALCDGAVYVETPGSVRSLNVASCAAVLMAEYTRQALQRAEH